MTILRISLRELGMLGYKIVFFLVLYRYRLRYAIGLAYNIEFVKRQKNAVKRKVIAVSIFLRLHFLYKRNDASKLHERFKYNYILFLYIFFIYIFLSFLNTIIHFLLVLSIFRNIPREEVLECHVSEINISKGISGLW